ncbi:MAG: M20/M25/M40 family metallo-hydrolase [Gammaproteobacteria bacterium]|nr:M20/M25/M40 family metallo-hydrolase [Gammaproteobacteria bacterium]
MLDQDATSRFVEEIWDDSIVPTLCEYVRIPNKSPAFDPDWESHGHMQRAVELLQKWCATAPLGKLTYEIIKLPGRTPVLLCEVPSTGGNGTVLLYGHYDKQPEFTGWAAGLSPWEPVLRDGKLYGRGGADDGYALFGSLTAIAALEQQNIPHSRCIVLIEGCEESGSFDLPFYVEALRERIEIPDLVVCLDAECGNYDQLWTTTSLRGMLPGVLSVAVLSEGQHSGVAGGIVPSTFRIMRQLFERVENAATGELHPALYVDIPREVRGQLREVADVLENEVENRFPWLEGVQAAWSDPVELLINNSWRPSLATVGLSGAPEVHNAGNTLRPSTSAKLVFRLPPTLDAENAAREIKAELEREPPHGAHVTFETETAQTGWCAPAFSPWLEKSLHRGSMKFFNKPAMFMGMGGTIPFMKMLGDAYPGVQFMVTGVLGPNSNAHGPNEFLEIATGKKVTACVSQVLADHANRR